MKLSDPLRNSMRLCKVHGERVYGDPQILLTRLCAVSANSNSNKLKATELPPPTLICIDNADSGDVSSLPRVSCALTCAFGNETMCKNMVRNN